MRDFNHGAIDSSFRNRKIPNSLFYFEVVGRNVTILGGQQRATIVAYTVVQVSNKASFVAVKWHRIVRKTIRRQVYD